MLIKTKSLCERKITSAFTGLSPSVPVMFDNVQDETPGGEANFFNLVQPRYSGLEKSFSKSDQQVQALNYRLSSCGGRE